MRLSPILAFAQAQVKDVLAAMTADGRLWLWDLRSNEPLADVSISDGDTTAIPIYRERHEAGGSEFLPTIRNRLRPDRKAVRTAIGPAHR